jgi:hypothetical protein
VPPLNVFHKHIVTAASFRLRVCSGKDILRTALRISPEMRLSDIPWRGKRRSLNPREDKLFSVMAEERKFALLSGMYYISVATVMIRSL